MIAGLILASCSGSINGQVFLDKNQNGTMDADETGIAYAKLVVTRDGKVIAEKYSDGNGAYTVHVRQRKGQLCIKPDLTYAQENLNFIQSSMGKAAKIKTLKAETSTTPGTSTGTGTDTGGETGSSETGDTTVDTNQPAKPEPPEGKIGDQYCYNFKNKGLEVNIPVKVDFEAALSEMPTRLEAKCFSGAACEIKIPYPTGCQLDTIYLPPELVADPAQPGISFSASLNSVSFEQPALTGSNSGKAVSTTGSAISISGFEVADLKLKVKDDASDTDLTLNPTAQCLGETLDLQKIPISIKRDINYAVYQHTAKTLDLHPGDQVDVEVTVDNKGQSPLIDGELTFTSPDGASLIKGTDCALQTSGQAAVAICKIDKIDPKSIQTMTFKMTLPEWTNQPSGYSDELMCGAVFTTSGSKVEAEDISFEVKKP